MQVPLITGYTASATFLFCGTYVQPSYQNLTGSDKGPVQISEVTKKTDMHSYPETGGNLMKPAVPQ